eukprot:3933090-Rhodomonas_salina.3
MTLSQAQDGAHGVSLSTRARCRTRFRAVTWRCSLATHACAREDDEKAGSRSHNVNSVLKDLPSARRASHSRRKALYVLPRNRRVYVS